MSSIKEFNTYLNNITGSLNLEQEEERELQEEWYQHLIDLMDNFIYKGFTENEAIVLAIKQFGEVQVLKSEINKNFLNPRKLQVIKELVVWFICLIAASVGPSLLINAHYSISFSIGPIVLLGICYTIYHFILKGLKSFFIRAIALPFLYGSFIYFIVSVHSFSYFIDELLSPHLGGDGLFTISMIHLFWIIIISKNLFTTFPWKQRVLNITQWSFEYWSMVMIAIFIIITELLTNSGEGKTIIGNIFLLYGFLEQLIDPRIFIQSNNKIKYWLKV